MSSTREADGQESKYETWTVEVMKEEVRGPDLETGESDVDWPVDERCEDEDEAGDEFEGAGAKHSKDAVEAVEERGTRGPTANSVNSSTLHGPCRSVGGLSRSCD